MAIVSIPNGLWIEIKNIGIYVRFMGIKTLGILAAVLVAAAAVLTLILAVNSSCLFSRHHLFNRIITSFQSFVMMVMKNMVRMINNQHLPRLALHRHPFSPFLTQNQHPLLINPKVDNLTTTTQSHPIQFITKWSLGLISMPIMPNV